MQEKVPFYKNQIFIMMAVVVVIILGLIIFQTLTSDDQESIFDIEYAESGGELAVLTTEISEGPFTITYIGSTPDGLHSLQVSDSSPSGRQKAIQWISNQGYDLSTTSIEFVDYTSPFVSEDANYLE